MADNARFHNKYHRRNHHTLPSAGFPDSGSDPIASQAEPFQGSFYVQGSLSASNNLTIGGNTIIYGNLSALGDVSVIDTFVTVTSALSVVNKGTGPAFTVVQEGIQDIAVFLDDTRNALKIMDGAKIRFFEEGSSGAIGINTTDLTNALTIKGSVSASGSLNINGSTILGDTNTDTTTINGTTVSIPNNLNIDSNTLYINSSNDRVGIGTATPNAKLTVSGDVSATNSIVGVSLSSRFVDISHTPANDGSNPYLRIGEATSDVVNFSGFKLEYDELLNTFNLSSIGFDAQKQIVQIEKGGLVTLANGICAVGTSYTQFLTSRDVTIAHSPANDGTNPTLSIGEYTFASTTLSAFSGYRVIYDETTNDLNLSATGFNTSKEALKITSAGNTRVNLLSAVSPNYDNLIAVTRGISGAGFDNLSHLIDGRIGVNNQAPVSSYAMHIKGGNVRVDGVDFSSIAGFDGTLYDSDGQSLFDLRSANENANYSVSIASSGLNNFMKFFGGRSLDQNPFVAVRKGQPIRFAQLNNFYGQGFSEVARIGGNSNVSIGLSADGAERLTVLGNISASGNVLFYSSTGRNLDLIHTPANDGTNPVLRIGEFTPGSTTLSGFSGAFVSYDEFTNVFGISSLFLPEMGIPAISITKNGNVGIGTNAPSRQLNVALPSGNTEVAITTDSSSVASLYFGYPSNDNRGQIRYYNSGDSMGINVATQEAVRIRGGGQVGIGVSLPAEKLTVSGNISASGNVLFYSSTGRNLDLIHTPANDGTNPVLRIGECTPGDTALSGFSGAFVSYDEFTNVFGISSVFAPAMGAPAMSIDRNGNVGMGTTTPNEKLTVFGNISASGTITAGNVANTSYYLAIGPFCSAGTWGSGTLQSQVGTASVYPRALSGVMPANELSSRLKNGQGTIEGNFLFEKTENVITAQWYIEIAKNEVFTNTLSAVYLRTAGDNTRSIFRPVIGTNIGNNYIVMPASNSTTPYGGSGSNTINYPYAPGDTLYWRVGFNNPGTVGTSIGMALCAGYIRIVP